MPVIFMERSLLDSLTEADIKEIIDENEGHTKYARLEGYYEGDHDILRHRKKDSTAPNNRLVNNMAKYITDTATGYFIGKPVVYSSQNDAYLEALQDIFDYNDEQDENMELAKGASINGDCFEMLYLDEDAQIRFTKVPPDGCIYICETGYNTPMAAIRIVYSKDKDKNIIKKVEFWTAQDCWYFRSINGGALELLDIFHMADLSNAQAGSLPYGAQRRLEIMRALATGPKLLLLDEPAAGMNPSETAELTETIRRIRDEFNIAVLLIEHDMGMVMSLSDRIFVMEYGSRIAAGTPEEIRHNPEVIRAYLGESDNA